MAFQMMFAIITPALITGAFAERKRFKAMVVFTLLWATLVYAPVAHWVWGVGGWLREYGALDFAGGTVVHITAGIAALVAAMMLGKRIGFGSRSLEPHNLTYTVLGAGLLWFGWFGFNGGSALGANGLAASALVVTNTAAAMGGLAWMTASWLRHGHPSVLGLAAGAVAGLVAITPAAGFVNTPSAVLIGLGAGVLCFFAVDILKRTIGVDDALDVFAVHGVGGIWGALATGLFASTAVNPAGSNGLFYGNPEQLLKQAVAVGVVIVFTAAVTWVILKVIDVTIGLRVPEQEEVLGLDSTTHGEVAYQL
jgi:Amt family ammonium transporter